MVWYSVWRLAVRFLGLWLLQFEFRSAFRSGLVPWPRLCFGATVLHTCRSWAMYKSLDQLHIYSVKKPCARVPCTVAEPRRAALCQPACIPNHFHTLQTLPHALLPSVPNCPVPSCDILLSAPQITRPNAAWPCRSAGEPLCDVIPCVTSGNTEDPEAGGGWRVGSGQHVVVVAIDHRI